MTSKRSYYGEIRNKVMRSHFQSGPKMEILQNVQNLQILKETVKTVTVISRKFEKIYQCWRVLHMNSFIMNGMEIHMQSGIWSDFNPNHTKRAERLARRAETAVEKIRPNRILGEIDIDEEYYNRKIKGSHEYIKKNDDIKRTNNKRIKKLKARTIARKEKARIAKFTSKNILKKQVTDAELDAFFKREKIHFQSGLTDGFTIVMDIFSYVRALLMCKTKIDYISVFWLIYRHVTSACIDTVWSFVEKWFDFLHTFDMEDDAPLLNEYMRREISPPQPIRRSASLQHMEMLTEMAYNLDAYHKQGTQQKVRIHNDFMNYARKHYSPDDFMCVMQRYDYLCEGELRFNGWNRWYTWLAEEYYNIPVRVRGEHGFETEVGDPNFNSDLSEPDEPEARNIALAGASIHLQGPGIIDHAVKQAFPERSVEVLNSSVMSSFRKLLVLSTLAPFLLAGGFIDSKAQFHEWYDANMSHWVEGTETALNLTNFIILFYRSGIPYLKTGNPIYLYPANPVDKWMEDSLNMELDLQDKMFRAKMVMDGAMHDHIIALDKCIAAGRMLMQIYDKDTRKTRMNDQIARLLRQRKDFIQHEKTKEMHSAPMVIILHGGSSVGKSMIVEVSATIFRRHYGLKSSRAKYVKNVTEKFWSGFCNEPIVVFDDVGSLKSEVEGSANWAMEYLQVIGDMAYPVAQAAVEDKGKIMASFRGCILTTNWIKCNVHQVFNGETPFMRRAEFFSHCYLIPEAMKDGVLDTKYASEHPDGSYYRMDIYKAHVKSITQSDWEPYIEYEGTPQAKEMTGLTIGEYQAFLKRRLVAYDAKTKSVKGMTKRIQQSAWCDQHQQLTFSCGCPDIQPDENLDFPEQTYDQATLVRLPLSEKASTWSKYNEAIVEKPNIHLQGPSLINYFTKPKKDRRPFRPYTAFKKRVGKWIGRQIITQMKDPEVASSIINNVVQPSMVNAANEVSDKMTEIRNTVIKAMGALGTLLVTLYAARGMISMLWSTFKEKDKKIIHTQALPKIGSPEEIQRTKDMSIRVGYPIEQYMQQFPATQPKPYVIDVDQSAIPLTGEYYACMVKTACLNSCTLLLDGNNEASFTRGFFVTTNILCMNRHALENDSGSIVVCSRNGTEEIREKKTYSKKDVFKLSEEEDLVFIRLAVNPRVDITEYFRKEGDRPHGTLTMIRNPLPKEPSACTLCPATETSVDKPWRLVYNKMDYKTIDGDCGSLYINVVNKNNCFIDGFHHGIVFETNEKVMKIITREQIMKAKEHFGVSGLGSINRREPIRDLIHLQALHKKSILRHGEGHLSIIGTNPMAPIVKHKEAMVRSVIADYLPDHGYVNPCFKHKVVDGKYIDPALARIAIMDHAPKDVNPDFLDMIDEAWYDIYKDNPWSELVPMDLYTALNGVDGTLAKRKNIQTSGGFGYKKKFEEVRYEKPGGPHLVAGSHLLDDMEKTYDTWLRGECVRWVAVMTPKVDEAITQAKVDAGKSRMFIQQVFEFLTWQNIVEGPIYAMYRKRRKTQHSAIGINCSSNEWGKLGTYLQFGDGTEKGTFIGDKICDLDYAWWDALMCWLVRVMRIKADRLLPLSPWYMKEVEWFPNKPKKSALWIYENLINELAIMPLQVRGDLFWCKGILPSGKFGTAEDNSELESFAHLAIYYLTAKNANIVKSDLVVPPNTLDPTNPWYDLYSIVPRFSEYVLLSNYGDDNVDNTAEEILYFYNPDNRAIAGEQLGLQLTDARKEGKPKFVPLEKVLFLKRRFSYDPTLDIWLAPLELKSIDKMLTMIHYNISLSNQQLTAINVETALREYFMHGRDVFNEKRSFLLTVCKKENIDHLVKNWWEFDDLLKLHREDGLHLWAV